MSNWITQAATVLPAQITDTTPAETIELGELYTYVQQKKNRSTSCWAVARDTGLIVGQAVSQERSLETFQALADTVPPAQRYASDGLAVYAELIWPEGGQYVLSRRKEETYTIESLNANLRTYLARLARSSRCFSRSLEALQRAVRLFVYHYNRRQRLYLAHPAYRGRLPLLF